MSRIQSPEAVYRAFSPDALTGGLAPFSVTLSNDRECEIARALAAELITPNVASVAVLKRVQRLTRASVYSHREDGETTGVLAIVPLSPAGLAAVEDRSFDPIDPADAHLCLPGEPLAGVYGWGMAARSKDAGRAVVKATVAMHEFWPETPFFTRAATPDGVRLITGKWGFVPHTAAGDDLLVLLPRTTRTEAAA